MTQSRRHATIVGLVSILIWGATIPWMRTVSDALGPMAGGTWMCAIAAMILWAVRLLERRPLRPRVSFRTVAVNGSLFTTYMVCFTAAIGFATTRSESVTVGLVNYLWPSLAVLFAPLFGRRRIRPLLVAAVGIALCGTIVALLGGGDVEGAFTAIVQRPLPYLLAAVAAVCWAIYSNTAAFGVREGDESAVVVYATLAAAGTVAVTASTGGLRWMMSPSVLLSTLLLGAANAYSYHGWDNAVRFGDRRVVSTAALFTPVLSVTMAAVSFGRVPGVHVWAGACLLVVAALVATRTGD